MAIPVSAVELWTVSRDVPLVLLINGITQLMGDVNGVGERLAIINVTFVLAVPFMTTVLVTRVQRDPFRTLWVRSAVHLVLEAILHAWEPRSVLGFQSALVRKKSLNLKSKA